MAPTPAWTTAFSATWEGVGDAADARVRRATSTRAPAARPRTAAPTTSCSGRTRPGPAMAPPIAAVARATARCRCCSATGTGRAGATCGSATTASTTTTRWAATSCGGSRPARRRGCTPRPTAGRPLQLWGMGIASQDLTGDGLPGGLPHQPGRQQAPDARRRPGAARLPRHRAQARRRPPPSPSAGGDPLPSTAWHPEFQDVNNDGLHRPVRVQGQRRARSPTTRSRDPSNLFLGQPDGTFAEGAEAAGHRHLRRGSRGGARRLQPGRPAGPRRGRTSTRRCGCGATSGPARPTRRRRWAAGSRSGCASPAATATRSARSSRRRSATRSPRREVIVGGGHIGGQLGWHARRARAGGARRRSG